MTPSTHSTSRSPASSHPGAVSPSPDPRHGEDAAVTNPPSADNGPLPTHDPDDLAGQMEADGLPMQRTLAAPAVVEGLGLFLGQPVTCTILPAATDAGIVFERVDLPEPVRIPALVSHVTPRSRRTTLRDGDVTIDTVEHCLSALAGLRIDNALIRITGPELPCGDGSARPFVDAIHAAGIVRQTVPRRFHRITEPVTVEEGDAMLAALPAEHEGLEIIYNLDYGHDRPLPRQLHAFRLDPDRFDDEIASARTFSLESEARALRERGLCTHVTSRDVLVIGDDGPIDNEFRFPNEPVRHKILDLIGDLSLLGREIQGRIVAYRSGHDLNHRLVRRLFEQVRAVEQTGISGRRREMDIRDILRLMRHRFPMLLVDRVIEIDGDRRAVGVKNVSINEPFFQGHYPGRPIMPGVLIVEAMAQLSGLLLSQVLEHTGKIAVLLSLDKVKLRRPVFPGDQLVMEAETIHAQTRTAHVKCKAFVGGQLAAEAQIKFLMVDAEQE